MGGRRLGSVVVPGWPAGQAQRPAAVPLLSAPRIEEVIDGEGVGQQPLQRSNIILQLLVAQLDIGHAGLDIQALVFLGFGGLGSLVGSMCPLGLASRSGGGGCLRPCLPFGFPLDLDQRCCEPPIPAHKTNLRYQRNRFVKR